jgi:hypothetical protein
MRSAEVGIVSTIIGHSRPHRAPSRRTVYNAQPARRRPCTVTISSLELLAPAKNADFGIEAINHGADAVYIGGPSFGARNNAGNSEVQDIERLAALRASLPRKRTSSP